MNVVTENEKSGLPAEQTKSGLWLQVPENIIKWLKEQDGANLAININNVGADSGYVHKQFYTVEIRKITRTCHRCGYDPLWNPDGSNCIKSVEDALNQIAYHDDGQIAASHFYKVYSDCPRVEVIIEQLESRKRP